MSEDKVREGFERIEWQNFKVRHGVNSDIPYTPEQKECYFFPFDNERDIYGNFLMNERYKLFKQGFEQGRQSMIDEVERKQKLTVLQSAESERMYHEGRQSMRDECVELVIKSCDWCGGSGGRQISEYECVQCQYCDQVSHPLAEAIKELPQ